LSESVRLAERDNARWIGFLLCVVIGTLIACIIILSCVPPVSKDALVHHLAVPRLYLKHGGMYEIPFMSFSYYPMNLDLLYLIPLYFGNDIIPKFIHFCFALFTAWLIFDYLKRRINTLYGLTGALLFLSIPIIIKLSITVYVDLGLISFSTASLLLLFRWMENGFRVRTLVFSAVFCGLALGTKYNGLVTFFLLTLFVPFMYSRYNQAKHPGFLKSAGQGLLFFLIALLVFSPCMVRNYQWKKNPIYPLYNKWFNPPNASLIDTIPRDADKKKSHGLFTYRSVVYNETWWEIFLLPVRIFFQGKDANPQYFDGKLNPFLLFLPVLAFFRVREGPAYIRNEKRILLVFSVLFFVFAFFSQSLRIRYISPIIPPLVILSVFGIRQMFQKVAEIHSQNWRRVATALVFGAVAVALGINGLYIYGQFKEVDPFGFLSGSVSRDDYIDKYRFEYPAIRYINKTLPRDAKIFFIFIGNRGYYCDRDYVFDNNTLHKIVKGSDSPEQVLNKLIDKGNTHLLIRYDLFDKWKKDAFNNRELYLLKQFMIKYSKMLFFKWGYGVSRLENVD
jgi:dolichyl-phosphate-mannose-protein mannosyltransferase